MIPLAHRLENFLQIYGFRFVKSNSLCLLFWLKERITLKGYIVCLRLAIASNHSTFPPTDVSACKVPAILKKFVSKEATSEAPILKLFWQPGRVFKTSSRPTRN